MSRVAVPSANAISNSFATLQVTDITFSQHPTRELERSAVSLWQRNRKARPRAPRKLCSRRACVSPSCSCQNVEAGIPRVRGQGARPPGHEAVHHRPRCQLRDVCVHPYQRCAHPPCTRALPLLCLPALRLFPSSGRYPASHPRETMPLTLMRCALLLLCQVPRRPPRSKTLTSTQAMATKKKSTMRIGGNCSYRGSGGQASKDERHPSQ